MKKAVSKYHKHLAGRTVMVHPQLTTDPYNKRGAIGMISKATGHEGNAHAEVIFRDGNKGLYDADALLTLYPLAIIRQGLQSNYNMLNTARRDAIRTVMKLINAKDHEGALRLALSDETLQFYCSTDCRKFLELKVEKKRKNNKRPGR